jgi:hypothetical protein
MPLKDCPFSKLSDADIPRPILPIKIINPHTALSYATFGIIDTGADECAVPILLGVNSFLCKFIVNINYPRNVFSVTSPPK